MQAYNLMGYDAFTPGELDLSSGWETLLQLSQQGKFPFLAANLLDPTTGKPAFQAHQIKESRGIKIGLIGLLSNRLHLDNLPGEKGKFFLEDPIKTAKNLVPQLKKRCQVLVVLGHMELDEQIHLAQEVPGIHFILSGHVSHYQREPIRLKDTWIFNAGARGEHLGQVDLFVENGKLQSRFHLIPLAQNFSDHQEVQEMVNRYKTEWQSLVQRLTQASRQTATDPSVREGPQPLFMGEAHCSPCHQAQHQSWLRTDHARAFQTLAQKNRASDPACLSCHTTAFGSLRNSGANLENVQCEACHGPGEGHPEKRENLWKISLEHCLPCHNKANSPHFEFLIYLQRVQHPRG